MMKEICLSVMRVFALVTILVPAGCRDRKPVDFSFRYSMESVNNYKLTLTFNSDKTYEIGEYNYLTDAQAPVVRKGALTDTELEQIRTLLAGCRFFAMKDAYGFDVPAEERFENILYQVHYVADGKEKMISIRAAPHTKLPQSYHELLKFIGLFIKKYG
ncbi:MAG: hypothetical protein LBJ23_06275 [Tannerella sp.]|nr:hypothetical protein [Tannerella sp.]